ncbi:protein of unknown function [Candidatus Methylomirabilis oxygeniifera]|uniref:Uncharacterized protein n=1 Tax=Methylomirabilis oxygeniifera TaxID=671143 RepID=D5MH46_METO1|nr:protein of unknown function [Candidatus Methylomirabilis oxyfera]
MGNCGTWARSPSEKPQLTAYFKLLAILLNGVSVFLELAWSTVQQQVADRRWLYRLSRTSLSYEYH